MEWRNKLVDSGWGAPHWPTDWYGRDLSVGLVPIVDEEFDKESNEALLRFLDRIYYVLMFFMTFFACGSIYFFTKCEILNVCKI